MIRTRAGGMISSLLLLSACAAVPGPVAREASPPPQDVSAALEDVLTFDAGPDAALYAPGGRLGIHEWPGEWETGLGRAVWRGEDGLLDCFDGFLQAGAVDGERGELHFLLPGPEAERTLTSWPWGYEAVTHSEGLRLTARVTATGPDQAVLEILFANLRPSPCTLIPVLRSRTERGETARNMRWVPGDGMLVSQIARGEGRAGALSIIRGLHFAMAFTESPEAVHCTDEGYAALEMARRPAASCHRYFWTRSGRAVAYIRFPEIVLNAGEACGYAVVVAASGRGPDAASDDARRLRRELLEGRVTRESVREDWNRAMDPIARQVGDASRLAALKAVSTLRRSLVRDDAGRMMMLRRRDRIAATRTRDVCVMAAALAEFAPAEAEDVLNSLYSRSRTRSVLGGAIGPVEPPWTAWAAWEVYTRTGSAKWLAGVYALERQAFESADVARSGERDSAMEDDGEVQKTESDSQASVLKCQAEWLARMAVALGRGGEAARWTDAAARLPGGAGFTEATPTLRQQLGFTGDGGKETGSPTDGVDAAIVLLEALGREGPCRIPASLL